MFRRNLRLLLVLLVCTTVLASGAFAAPKEPVRPRVLILGDSISMGYTAIVRSNLADRADVFRPKGNCQHTAYGIAQIKNWLGDKKWDVIHFNWGIWDTHMLDEQNQLVRDEEHATGKLHIRHTPEQYRENLTQLVKVLEATGAKLIFANTTPIPSRTGARFDDIKKLNEAALEVMQKRNVPVNDLYQAVLPNAEKWQTSDKVHFNDEGNKQLGKLVSDRITQLLPAKPVAAAR